MVGGWRRARGWKGLRTSHIGWPGVLHKLLPPKIVITRPADYVLGRFPGPMGPPGFGRSLVSLKGVLVSLKGPLVILRRFGVSLAFLTKMAHLGIFL